MFTSYIFIYVMLYVCMYVNVTKMCIFVPAVGAAGSQGSNNCAFTFPEPVV